MRFRKDINLIDFLKEVKNCRSDVYLKTEDNNMLNLKSELSQYVFVVIAEKKEFLGTCEVTCTDARDQERLAAYLAA